jgi:hypothetical protein
MSSFNEELYLAANPDVAAAVARGQFASGRQHYNRHGRYEGRPLVPTTTPASAPAQSVASAGFNEELYLAANPDVAAAVARGQFASGRMHYNRHGRFEGRPLAPTEAAPGPAPTPAPAPVPPPASGPEPLPSSAMESRAQWMINTYKNLTIGAPTEPNGAGAQKFGWADTLTRLRLNPNDRAPIQRFVELFKNGNFNNAFMPAGAGWILTQYWDKFTENERNSIILPVLRNANLLSHGTENHFLIRYVGAHLFSQLWPNENQWIDSIRGRRITSSELAQFTKTKLLETLRSYYSKGYTEHLSPNYLPVHFYALHALYNNTNDPELKAAADAAMTFHVADMAANFFYGQTIAPYDRVSPTPVVDAPKNSQLNNHIKAMYWLYWAEFMNTPSTQTASFYPNAGARDEAKHFAVTSALSAWRPPALLTALADGRNLAPYTLKSTVPTFGNYGTGAPSDTLRTVYRDERFTVGSGIFQQRIDNGLSERMGLEIAYKTTDSQNTIVFHHPYWRSNSNQYKWMSRSSPFQQNVQHESTIISLFNIPKADPFAGRTRADWEKFRDQNRNQLIQQAWIRYPKAADEVVETSGWVFLREGETYVAIRPWNPYAKVTNEFPDMNVLRSSGATNAIISDVATVDQFRTFTQFRSAVLAAPLKVNLNPSRPSVSYRNVRGDTITAQWNQPDYSAPKITSWPTATVNGVVQAQDPDFLNGRAVIKSAPLTVANRVLTVKLPAGQMQVDWRNKIPVFSDTTSSSRLRASYSSRVTKPGRLRRSPSSKDTPRNPKNDSPVDRVTGLSQAGTTSAASEPSITWTKTVAITEQQLEPSTHSQWAYTANVLPLLMGDGCGLSRIDCMPDADAGQLMNSVDINSPFGNATPSMLAF